MLKCPSLPAQFHVHTSGGYPHTKQQRDDTWSMNLLLKELTFKMCLHTHTHLPLFSHNTQILTNPNKDLFVWSNKSMEVLIPKCFQMKRCTVLCWDCFYLAASSSPPWPGNHNTACGCIAATTGGWFFSTGLPFSALSVCSFVFCICIQAGHLVVTFNLPDFPLARWWNSELSSREVGLAQTGKGTLEIVCSSRMGRAQ